jgi:uncharacterized membrane protein YkvA (DUF1232 family)
MGAFARARAHARRLKRDAYALYFVMRDRRTPWYVRAVAATVVAYALSPFDLIPDFVPVLGYLDDLVIVPLGVALVVKMVPADVLADCRAQAESVAQRPVSRAGALVVISVWLVFGALVFLIVRNALD